jgi:hypothetical protein
VLDYPPRPNKVIGTKKQNFQSVVEVSQRGAPSLAHPGFRDGSHFLEIYVGRDAGDGEW